MKELLKIIEALKDVNKQVIEKDNIINNYTNLINLFSRLLDDKDFVVSDIYLDLRLKYIAEIEEKIKTVNESIIVSEHGNYKKKPQFNSSEVNGPIYTDIYVAPCNRMKFVKKKKTQQSPTWENHVSDNMVGHEYISFTYHKNDYYIDTTPVPTESPFKEYKIYNKYLRIAGNLKGPRLTLLNESDLSSSNFIDLKSIPVNELSSENDKLFGMYAVI